MAGETAFEGGEDFNVLRKTGAAGAIPTRDLPLMRDPPVASDQRSSVRLRQLVRRGKTVLSGHR